MSEAERRQLTVLFCDLVGSTELAVKLDPEDMRDILAAYRTVCGEAMSKYGSTIIQHSGDGAMIIFGYPMAHENATESAILAAMDILAAFKDKKSKLANFDTQLNARIAINTGQVVVGNDGATKAGEEISVIGDVPNLAARLQNLAEPGQIIVSQATYRLTKHQFSYRDMGMQDLKGFSTPVRCYSVDASILKSATTANTESGRRTPLIGRQAELSLLEQRWQSSFGGDGQVMLLSGEAGVGKSRILQAFNEKNVALDINIVRFFSSSFHTHSTLNPVLNELRMRFGLDEEADDAGKFQRLKSGLKLEQQYHLPVLAKMLNIQTPKSHELKSISPEALKQQAMAAILAIYSDLANEKPLLMEFEDIHWCDPTTLELIDHLIGMIGGKPWYLILAFRPDYKAPFRNLPYITSLTLNRFGKNEISELIQQIANGKPLPENLTTQIVERADGIPLYAEEITRMVLESGWITEVDGIYVMSGTYVPLAIPDSLQGSLMARLDRFPSAKEVAQIAATIGRRFTAELLSLVSGHSGNQLFAVLDQLLDAELIYEYGFGAEKTYEFKHALVQDAAYQSLLRTARQKCHQRIAEMLESNFPDIRDTEPEVLARHFHSASNWEKSFEYSLNAGKNALNRSANLEALTHLGHALEDLQKLPPAKQRDKDEFELLVLLAVPQATVLGYSHENVSKTYERAMELADGQSDTSAILPVIYGLGRYHMLAARFDEGSKYQSKLLELATNLKNKPMITAARRVTGATAFYRGQHEKALREMQAVIGTKLTKEERAEVLKHDVVDLEVAAYSYSSLSEWLIGNPDTSRKIIEQAIVSARETEHAFSIAFALLFGAWTYSFCGDYQRGKELAEEGYSIAKQYSFQFWIGWAEVMRAWTTAKLDEDYKTGAEQIAIGIEHWKETRSRVGLSYFLYLQADLNFASGNYIKAHEVLDEAETFVEQTKEGFWAPEITRMRGQITLAESQGMPNPVEGVEAATQFFDKALKHSNETGADSLALRALTSKAQMKHPSKKDTKSQKDLEKLINSMSQGKDTYDVIAAKAVVLKYSKEKSAN
ncbi:MAG: adenylate/guanylate cyclase domain-containing protein [Salaquimonas sp.]